MRQLLPSTLPFGVSGFLTSFLSSAAFPRVCLLRLPKCARPLPRTITNNMGWKLCFSLSTICWSLGRRKIVLCAESIRHAWRLMTGGMFHLQNVIYNHVRTPRHPDTHALASCPRSHLTNMWRKEQRTIWRVIALSVTDSRECQWVRQSFSQEELLLPVFKMSRK